MGPVRTLSDSIPRAAGWMPPSGGRPAYQVEHRNEGVDCSTAALGPGAAVGSRRTLAVMDGSKMHVARTPPHMEPAMSQAGGERVTAVLATTDKPAVPGRK